MSKPAPNLFAWCTALLAVCGIAQCSHRSKENYAGAQRTLGDGCLSVSRSDSGKLYELAPPGASSRPFIEQPVVFNRGQETLFLGVPTIWWPSDSRRAADSIGRPIIGSGVSMTARGPRVVSPLPSAEPLSGTRFARDLNGELVALWATRSDGAAKTPIPTRAKIWASSLGSDLTWSPPVLVAEVEKIRWVSDAISQLVALGSDLFLAAPSDGPGDLIEIRREHGRWAIQTRTLPSSPAYVSAGSDGRGRLHIVFVAADARRGSPGTNVVFHQSSSDLGRTWTPPRRVYSEQRLPGHRPELVKLRNGNLVAVWGQQREGAAAAESLLVAMTTDGENWNLRYALAPPAGFDLISVLPVGDRVHAVVRLTSSPGTLAHVTFDSSQVSGWATVDASATTHPSLMAPRPGLLALSWGEMDSTALGGIPVTRFAELRPCEAAAGAKDP